jgi:hypothetical protein
MRLPASGSILFPFRSVMGEDILRPVEAIGIYRQLITDERGRLAPEPQNIESAWISLISIRAASGSTWTDGISGRVRDGCRFSTDHLRSRYGSEAGFGSRIVDARLA